MTSSMQRALRHVLWDWNGTLLDDVALCLEALHALCLPRNLPLMTLERYREVFTFPVIEYYKAAGFDFDREPFEIPAGEWVRYYSPRVFKDAALFPGVVPALDAFQAAGIGQTVLSAQQHEELAKAVRHFGLLKYFEAVLGKSDFNGESKVALGRAWMENADIDPKTVLLVGDTLHDHEVAEDLGVKCILVARGHQSRSRLEGAGVPVVDNIENITRWVLQAPQAQEGPAA